MEEFLLKAKKEGIKTMQVALIVEKNDKILLLEPRSLGFQKAYTLVELEVLPEENLQQAIFKASLRNLNLSIKKIKKFLTYKDSNQNTRTFYFVVEVHDPEDLQPKEHQSFAWVEPKESFGYPILETTREILDLYQRAL
jgi:ADP-ribose pyrophosphatase YjhB (NUDIX family)